MDRFALGHASGREWRPAVDACLAELGSLPASANVGFVYFTEDFAGDAQDIVDRLKAGTGIASWVGAAGAGILATAREYYGEPGIAVMAAGFPQGAFSVFTADAAGTCALVDCEDGWLEAARSPFRRRARRPAQPRHRVDASRRRRRDQRFSSSAA